MLRRATSPQKATFPKVGDLTTPIRVPQPRMVLSRILVACCAERRKFAKEGNFGTKGNFAKDGIFAKEGDFAKDCEFA